MGPWAHAPMRAWAWALGPLGPWAHGPLGPWAQGFSEKNVVLKIIAYVQNIAALPQKTNPFKSVLKVDNIKKYVFMKSDTSSPKNAKN